MKLNSVTIRNFKSIESLSVDKFGNFNVFIGKNNSGKSNILSAINYCFQCIKNKEFLNLNPPVGEEIDFFNKVYKTPIEIHLSFLLSSETKAKLIDDIISEAPQMKNAVNGLDSMTEVAVVLCIIFEPKKFSFIQEIFLFNNKNTNGQSDKISILAISQETALELYDHLNDSQNQHECSKQLLDFVNKNSSPRMRRSPMINRKDWQSEKDEIHLSYMLKRNDISLQELLPNHYLELEQKYRESSSYEDFLNDLKTLATQLETEIKQVQKEPLKNKVNTFAGDETYLPNYAKNILYKICQLNVLHLTERRKPIGEEEAQRILSLKVKRGGQKDLSNIQETVLSLLGVRIDAFISESSPKDNAELDVDDFLVEVNGSGIREALRLVLDVEFGHPNILLVEEPEIHLHPALETSIMHYLKRISAGCQVFLTTHSTNFLDTAEMQNVYLVSKFDSTQVQSLNFEQAEAQLPKELGIRLSSLFMFDRLVFVEGQSDEDIIREWAYILEINLSSANVGFISMKGVRNFAYFATEEILSFLTRRQVRMWFLIDRDEKDVDEVSKLEKKLKETANMKVLNKREIENYLIVPKAILQFIEFKQKHLSDSPSLPTEENIKNLIEQFSDKFKIWTIFKRVSKKIFGSIHPNTSENLSEGENLTSINLKISDEIERIMKQWEERKENLPSICKQEQKDIESLWLKNKLDIIPGDLLLDQICQEYGVRFKKSTDGARLASFMDKEDIDSEIKDLIKEIGE